MLFAAAVLAFEAGPDGVELVHGGFHKRRIIRQDTGFKVTGAGALHSKTGAGKVCGADIGQFAVKDDNLEVDAGAKCTLQAGEQDWVMVEVFTEVGAWLLRMNQAHFFALLDKVGQQTEEGTLFNVKVLDIGRANP